MFKFKKSMFVVRYRWWIITATILIVLLSVVRVVSDSKSTLTYGVLSA
jgi:hypothetical protein